jgi:hypothetical protein
MKCWKNTLKTLYAKNIEAHKLFYCGLLVYDMGGGGRVWYLVSLFGNIESLIGLLYVTTLKVTNLNDRKS